MLLAVRGCFKRLGVEKSIQMSVLPSSSSSSAIYVLIKASVFSDVLYILPYYTAS